MIVDSDGRDDPQSESAAPASSAAVQSIPGVLGVVNDPLQFGGQQVVIPGFQNGAVPQTSTHLFGSQPGALNPVEQLVEHLCILIGKGSRLCCSFSPLSQ